MTSTKPKEVHMIVVRQSDSDVLETPGNNFTRALAAPARGATELLVLQQRQEPGGNNPLHSHDREEVMIQLEGTTTVTFGDDVVRLYPGDAVIVPAALLHQVRNDGDTPAQWILTSPIDTRFFRADGEEAHPAFLA